jgi:hypothetical protein
MDRQVGEAYARAALIADCLGYPVRPNWREDLPEEERVLRIVLALGERLERALASKASPAPRPPAETPQTTDRERVTKPVETPKVPAKDEGPDHPTTPPHRKRDVWRPGMALWPEWQDALSGLECETAAYAILRGKWRKPFKASLQEQVIYWLETPDAEREHREPLSPKQVRAWRNVERHELNGKFSGIRKWNPDFGRRAA